MKEMTLHELRELYGISRRAVQGYEKHGLVHATGKNERGHLTYDEAQVERIIKVRRLSRLGFKLRTVNTLLCAAPSRLREELINRRRELEREAKEKQEALKIIDSWINILDNSG